MLHEQSIENYHTMRVKYFGPGNVRGSKIKMYDDRFNTTKTIAYDPAKVHSLDQAVEYLVDNGYNVLGTAYIKGFDIIVLGPVDNQFKELA